jgi:hypothetical protein
MKLNTFITVSTVLCGALLLGVSGCAKRESADQTQHDVDKAQAEGAKDVAAAQKTADDKMADARNDLGKAQRAAEHESADIHRNLTVAEAEAAHKVSLERCESQSGDARASCKKIADAEFTADKARAEVTKATHDPTP